VDVRLVAGCLEEQVGGARRVEHDGMRRAGSNYDKCAVGEIVLDDPSVIVDDTYQGVPLEAVEDVVAVEVPVPRDALTRTEMEQLA
jgi:hypothetical protein